MEVKATAVLGPDCLSARRRLSLGRTVTDVVDRRDAGRSRQRRRGPTDSQLGCIDGFPAYLTDRPSSPSSFFQLSTYRLVSKHVGTFF